VFMTEFVKLMRDPALWDRSVLLQALIIYVIYLILVWAWPRYRGQPDRMTTRAKWLLFTLGTIVFYLSFGSPLDDISDDDLFSVHMFQHLLEMMVMTPLWLAGMPSWLLRRLFSFFWMGPRTFNPVVTVIVFNAVFFSFHIPLLYNETLASEWFHLFEHVLFFVAAVLLWMPVISPLPEISRLKPGALLLYSFLTVNFALPGQTLRALDPHPFYTEAPIVRGLL